LSPLFSRRAIFFILYDIFSYPCHAMIFRDISFHDTILQRRHRDEPPRQIFRWDDGGAYLPWYIWY
jgi:hypothetical protein